MDLTEKQQCIVCNRGCKLLVCSDDGCPISVHRSCMGCEAHLDDMGNFHCPYCLYRRLTAETSQLREKVMLTKKALSIFLEEEIKDDNHQEPIVEMADKGKDILSKDKICSVDTVDDNNNLVCDDDQNHCVRFEKYQQSKTTGEVPGINDVNTCRIMVVYKPNSNPAEIDLMKVNPKRKFEGVVDHQHHATSLKEVAQSKNTVSSSSMYEKITRRKRSRLVAFNKNRNRREEECTMERAAETLVSLQSKSNGKVNHDDSDNNILPKDRMHTTREPAHGLDPPDGGTKGSLEAEITNNNNPKELKGSPKQLPVIDRSINLPLQIGKHRVRWSEQEEDMLKKGVQKYSLLSRKNLPWKKILEFGCDVFDPLRGPSDLKDKWRKISK